MSAQGSGSSGVIVPFKKPGAHASLTGALCAFILLTVCGMQLARAERKTTYYHTDALGSVVAASDESGALLWRKEYGPYGGQLDTTAESEKLAYTGKEHDDSTGLMYFGARYYDPQIGRFLSVDPAAINQNDPLSFNRYAYVRNNPYRFVDPDGWDAKDVYTSLGKGYTSRVDAVPGTDLFEIHVYEDTADFRRAIDSRDPDLRRFEKGVVGPDSQWLRKHGHVATPKLPESTNNAIRGLVVQNARARSWIPDRGTALIKGKNLVSKIQDGMAKTGSLKYLAKLGAPLSIVGGVSSLLSIEKACQANSDFEAC